MTVSQMGNIVEHHLGLDLKKRGLSKNDFKLHEYNQELYQMALRLLVELRA